MATRMDGSGPKAGQDNVKPEHGPPRSRWERLRARLSESAWTALGGKAAAYVAGFFALSLVGSGQALSLLPQRSGGAGAAMALVYGGGAPLAATSGSPAAASAAGVREEASAAPPASAAAAAAKAPEAAASPGGGVTADGKVVLNLATEPDLRRLPGVGPAKAAAILALRAKLGRFRKIDDLLRVKGLGRRSLKRLRPLVLLDPS